MSGPKPNRQSPPHELPPPPLALPQSATHAVVAWIGVSCMLAACGVLNFWSPYKQIQYQALIVMTCTALGIFVPDLLWQKVYRRTLVDAVAPGNWERALTKYFGLAASVGLV